MAVLEKGRNLSKIFIKNTPLITCIRNFVDSVSEESPLFDIYPDTEDHLPGSYPKTKKERDAAAIKYGLHPDEYQPYGPKEMYVGDYPKLPLISYAAKDPYYPWDYPGPRLCYNETLPYDFYLLQGDRYDYGVRPRVNELKATAIYIGIIISFFVIDHFSVRASQPRIAKQYPKNGVHYTFELE